MNNIVKCPHCNKNTTTEFVCKIHITQPAGAKKIICMSCNNTFIAIPYTSNPNL